MKNIKLSHWISAIRWILGVVFLFSGIVKGIDPWGTALKINEYLAAFGLESLKIVSPFAAIAQCVLEALLGVLLISRKCLKFATVTVSLLLGFFTLLTLYIAIFNPLDDCGCFGNALKLNNWLTFAKNIILFPAAIFVWKSLAHYQHDGFDIKWILWPAVVLTSIFTAFWYFLPPVDSSPYHTRTNLRSDIMCPTCIDHSIVLVYEDMTNKQLHEFSLSDTTWYDTSRWHYIETRTAYDNVPDDIQQYEFSLWNNGSDHASEIVYNPGTTYMIILSDIAKLTERRAKKIADFIDRLYSGSAILVVGTDSETDAAIETFKTQRHTIPVYGIDSKVTALLLRADTGVVRIDDGTITAKRHLIRRNTLLK